ncbi:MAG TPA: DUF4267 domain-containing protein [Nocardioides sp.]|nr:DUF4267 domain-containing protein [Nocardioides sp.]
MDPVTGISLGRILIGICAFLAPELTAKVFGLTPATNPHLPYMTRMFAAREVAVGGLTLASSGTTRRTLALVGVAIDASDAATGALELQANRIPKSAGIMLIGVATGAVVSGAIGALRG